MYGSMPQQEPGVISGGEPAAASAMAKDGEGTSDKLPISHLSFDEADENDIAVPRESSFPSCLLPFVPEQSPLPWTLINNTLALSGCILILDMLYATGEEKEQREERPFATAFQLIWEFAVCFFWTLETSLSATYQHYHLHTPMKWYTKLEIVVAVYFMITTFLMLYQWNVMGQTPGGGEIFEVVLDTSFYVYLAVRSCSRATTTTEGVEPPSDQEQGKKEHDLENGVTSPYQIMGDNGSTNKTGVLT